MKKILYLSVPVIICFLVGYIAQFFQEDAIQNWYPSLIKSPLNPPNIVFPIAWSILYLLMGLSIGLICITQHEEKSRLIKLFAIQLLFNFLWSISFFYLQNPLLGFINILILDILIIYYAIKVYPVSKIASVLFIPYILWVGFASYLNGYILLYN